MKNQIPSVAQVLNEIKRLLEGSFRSVEVQGEVSNFSRSGAGHIYFTLSDKDSSLSCALFRIDALRNPQIKQIKDGDKIVVAGNIGVYNKRGTFQLITKQISLLGKGDLKEEFEKLKKRLAAEGLFELENKQKLPKFPKRVAIITAEGGAALQDFLNIFKRRSYWMDIILAPALVQGDMAAASMRGALHRIIEVHLKAPEEKKIDVIVLTRGGGSLEDLWAFNDEALAWDIYNCPIPIVSAVGHEVDFSISDMVADLRCETPSAAAEVLSEGQVQIKTTFERISNSLGRIGKDLLSSASQKLAPLNLEGRLMELTGYHDKVLALEEANHILKTHIPMRIANINGRLERSFTMLRALNPENVLGRGYCFMQDSDGKMISGLKSFNQLYEGDSLSVKFHDGKAQVIKK